MSAGRLDYSPWRFYLASFLVLSCAILLIFRMVDLTFFKRPFLLWQASSRSNRMLGDPAFRGIITDRKGYPLAVSAPVVSLWVDPSAFKGDSKSIVQFAALCGLSTNALIKRIGQNHHHFVWLKRGLPPETAVRLKQLKLQGVHYQKEYRRFYPEGALFAHIVGFTGIDDHGQEGLERVYDRWLSGQAGQQEVIKDRTGRVIQNLKLIHPNQPGRDVVLSLDRQIQYLASRELAAGIADNLADSGSVVVLDVKTGEVLAMANEPTFNPNHMTLNDKNAVRNRAVTDTFEPGSTIKTFSVASALEEGRFNLNSQINTSPGWMNVGRHLVRDEHNNGELSLMRILQLSSNVGMSKVILALPPSYLPHFLRRMGFGEVTESGFPGEQPGKLLDQSKWKPFQLATLSFGYGISVTALQLTAAYAILANQGVRVPISLLRVDEPPKGTRIIQARIANQLLGMLRHVLEKEGTGRGVNVVGYHVAGKTGTAWVAGRHGYEKHHYTSSFVGIAPVSHPRLVVAVVIHHPQGKQYFGGAVSGPVFEKIMQGALRILNVPQDAPQNVRKDDTIAHFVK